MKTTTIAVSIAAFALFLAAPGKAPTEEKEPFMGRNFAHRGLHDSDKFVMENSMAAFRRAVSCGYGIELDARITADGQIVIFHDDTLYRMCKVNARVEDLSWDVLKTFRLNGTDEGIPLLSEVLEMVGGRVPIILELKNCRKNRRLCEGALKEIRTYKGALCVESFNPFILRWFRKNAPEVIRGQLSCTLKSMGFKVNPGAFILSRLYTNVLSRPHFIAYGIGKKPLTVRLCEKLGAMKVAWTSDNVSHDLYGENDAVIFENYRPLAKFK
jgi:glycerophosphoryl diester phosphodiesterase